MAKQNQTKVNPSQVDEVVRRIPGQRSEEDLQLMKDLLQAPNLLLPETVEEGKTDRLQWKVELNDGREFILSDYVLEKVAPYQKKFPQEFFYLVADMFGIDRKEMDNFRKPRIVAIFIIQFIYARFPEAVFKQLKRRCKFTQVFGIREYKLFQWLSDERSKQLDLFIEQAMSTMEQSEGIDDFKRKYCEAFRMSFQTELFD